MTAQPTERIYIGGLDPSRGLTVELVASRLRSVPHVDILSINDVPITTNSKSTQSNRAIYTSDRANVVDEDGDLVDSRNFFFLEARSSTSPSSSASTSTQPSPVATALELLAKQYHNTKWKGCQLRVESAKPHFLKRLEEERAKGAALNAEKEQLKVEHELQQFAEEHARLKEGDDANDKPITKSRRRLRIRKRFGEEAFHVDTHPQTLEIATSKVPSNNAWNDFATLHKRMTDKHRSQQKKLMEKRKEERRLWASKGGSGKGEKKMKFTAEDEGLRSLMFLNRGIHIRFCDTGDKDGGEVENVEPLVNVGVSRDGGSYSSSVVSTSSSSSESSDSEESNQANGEKKSFVWSDDDNAGDSGSEASTEEIVALKEEAKWSDNDDDDSVSKSKPVSKGQEKHNEMGEFSGMDFGNVYYGIDEYDVDDINTEDDEDLAHGLEDGIRSNLGILAKMFPGEHIDKQPLAASINNDDESGEEAGATSSKQHAPHSTLGAGMIMQRYDPTKDKKYEVAVEKSLAVPKGEDNEQSESEDEVQVERESDASDNSPSEQDEEENGTQKCDAEEKTAANVEGEVVPTKDVYEQKKLENIFRQAREGEPEKFSFESMFQSSKEAESVPRESQPEKEIYEQDKLERIFKIAREESTGFSFGQMFESQLTDATKNKTADGSFSFGFGLGKAEQPVAATQNDTEEGVAAKEAALKPAGNEPKQELLQRKARKGLRFPESVLNGYEDAFFQMNDGARFMSDLDAMKNDNDGQDQWQKEKEILTADWKRKQKAALSRKVKKIRRR
jgi:hypothetical protein